MSLPEKKVFFETSMLNKYVVVLNAWIGKSASSSSHPIFSKHNFPYKKSIGFLLVDLIDEVNKYEERIDGLTYLLTVVVLLYRLRERVGLDPTSSRWSIFLCFVIASKIIDDFSWSNAFWAKRVSIDLSTFNKMERIILKFLDYRVSVTEDDIQNIEMCMHRDFLTIVCDEEDSVSMEVKKPRLM